MINGRKKCVFDRNGEREGDKLYIFLDWNEEERKREEL